MLAISMAAAVSQQACFRERVKPEEEGHAYTLGMAWKLYVATCLLADVAGARTHTDFSSSQRTSRDEINLLTAKLGLTAIPDLTTSKMTVATTAAVEKQLGNELRSRHGERVRNTFELGNRLGNVQAQLFMARAAGSLPQEWRAEMRDDVSKALTIGSTLGLKDELAPLRNLDKLLDTASRQELDRAFEAAVAPVTKHYAQGGAPLRD